MIYILLIIILTKLQKLRLDHEGWGRERSGQQFRTSTI